MATYKINDYKVLSKTRKNRWSNLATYKVNKFIMLLKTPQNRWRNLATFSSICQCNILKLFIPTFWHTFCLIESNHPRKEMKRGCP